MNWDALTRTEPRLKSLFQDIKAVKDDRSQPAFCANECWYGRGGFKDRLLTLVGWQASSPQLRSGAAYDLAYDKLYGTLPDCRGNCPCVAILAAFGVRKG